MSIEHFLAIRKHRILLDTNVWMKVEDAKKARVRDALLQFASQNEVYICDTVMYELFDSTIYLHNFRDKNAESQWSNLERNGKCTISLPAGYLTKLKNESWENYRHMGRKQDDLPLFGWQRDA